MKCYKTIVPCLLFIVSTVSADRITLYNRSSKSAFFAPYYKCSSVADRCGDIYEVAPHSLLKVERPVYRILRQAQDERGGFKFWCDRKLYIASTPEQLCDELTPEKRRNLVSQKIGWTQGDTFYIAEIDFRFKSFNSFEWNILQPVLEAGAQLFDEAVNILRVNVKKLLPEVRHNTYKKQTAHVRKGNQLCTQEIEYRTARKQKVKKSIESIIGRSIPDDRVPTIAIVASGGGFRAMLSTIGFLTGFEKTGLLDTVTYISALSGSTWAVGSWFASQSSVTQCAERLLPVLAPGLLPISYDGVCLMVNTILSKWCFEQPLTTIDFYGSLVGNRVLQFCGDMRHRMYLSDQAPLIQTGELPMPIYTAIRSESRVEPEWYEFTPFEIGGAWLEHYVPSWAYGRKFNAGKSIDCAPEQSLSALFGVFGSAFSATFNRMYDEIDEAISSDAVKKIIEWVLDDIGHQRLANSCFNNFTYGLKTSPIGKNKYIELCDAGIDFNLPYPVISEQRPERKPDIIIFLDTSADLEQASALQGAADYARVHNLAFPAIDVTDIHTRAITVFKDHDNESCPVVIYMPWAKDEQLWHAKKQEAEFSSFGQYLESFDPQKCLDEFCSTFNFEYSEHNAQQVCALSEFNVLACKDVVLAELEKAVRF